MRASLADPACTRTAAIALHRLGARDIVIPDPPASPLNGFTPPLEDEDEADIIDLVHMESLLADLGTMAAGRRASALVALGQRPMALPVERLAWALGDSDATVRAAALDVLCTQAPTALISLLPAAVAPLRGEPSGVFQSLQCVRQADLLAGLHADATRFATLLHTLLHRPYYEVRPHAVSAIPALTGDIPGHLMRRLVELRQDPQSSAVCMAAEDALAVMQ